MERFILVLLGAMTCFVLQTLGACTSPNDGDGNVLMLGGYTPGYVGDDQVFETEIRQWDQWAGKRLSIVGMFIDLEDSNPAFNVPTQLEQAFKNGYTPLVNLTSSRTAAEIAAGVIDGAIRNIAVSFRNWASNGGDRMAFLAPLPEMNGFWESYGEDPENFRQLYARIQDVFVDEQTPPSSIRWVFAPNGWSRDEHPFEIYYPGDLSVDVVAFSGYNWGECDMAATPQWQGPREVFQPFIDRMRLMAPEKPIFIIQTATTSVTANGISPSDKDDWLIETYRFLAEYPGVQAVIYFNIHKECDWAVYDTSGLRVDGYRNAVTHDGIDYVTPASMADIAYTRKTGAEVVINAPNTIPGLEINLQSVFTAPPATSSSTTFSIVENTNPGLISTQFYHRGRTERIEPVLRFKFSALLTGRADVTVQATETDGSTTTEVFIINLLEGNDQPPDSTSDGESCNEPPRLISTPILKLPAGQPEDVTINLHEFIRDPEDSASAYPLTYELVEIRDFHYTGLTFTDGHLLKFDRGLFASPGNNVFVTIRTTDSNGAEMIVDVGVKTGVTVPLTPGWNLISMPLDTDENALALFSNESADPLYTGQIWCWAGNRFEIIPVDGPLTAKTGYWIFGRMDLGDETESRLATGILGNAIISLRSGWNLIGVSANTAIPNDRIAGRAWSWNGQKMLRLDSNDELEVGRGYWLYSPVQ